MTGPPQVDVPQGAVAVVTGASRGLGAGLAARFAERGLRLGLCARTVPPHPDGVAPETALVRSVDVADPTAVDAFTDEVTAALGPITLWVGNAGVLEPIGPLRDADPAEVAAHLAVNVLGVAHGTAAYARHVRSHPGGGVLVNISSGAGRTSYAGWGPYCAAKAAVDRLTECVALEEEDAGLVALAVAPGVVDTGMQATIRATPAERFPTVERFHDLKAADAFNSPAWVADHLLAWAFGAGTRPEGVLVRVPDEPRP